MADDDDVIYVDVKARLDEASADEAAESLKDKFKDATEGVTDGFKGLGDKLKDEFSGIGHDGRATTTGIRTECKTVLLTEPSSMPVKPPRP